MFHSSTWAYYTLTKEEVEKLKALNKRAQEILVKKAAVKDEARDALKSLNWKFELEWMFWQAEYFGLCLLMPGDLLLKELENNWDLTSWNSIYKLAEIFIVKLSMMKTRLKKMKLIDVSNNGQISLVHKKQQMSLFNFNLYQHIFGVVSHLVQESNIQNSPIIFPQTVKFVLRPVENVVADTTFFVFGKDCENRFPA